MLVCALDFETTGLRVAEDRIIEVGAVLWDTDRKAPLVLLNLLVNPGVDVPLEITKLTGITDADVKIYGVQPVVALMELGALAMKAEAFVAHNGTDFDKPFFGYECQRNGLETVQLPWIDTAVDLPFPAEIKTRKLTHLAAEHGFLNPYSHRALSDVLTMLRIFSHYDAAEVLAVAQQPTIRLVANPKKPWEDPCPEGKKETDKAKARGYRFDGSSKKWVKNVKQNRVAEEMAHEEFAVVPEER